jgi:hypothetical protein
VISADEIRRGNGQVQFPLTVLEARQLSVKTDVLTAGLVRSGTTNELNLSGSQLMFGISVLCTVGLLIWVFLKVWLFEQ